MKLFSAGFINGTFVMRICVPSMNFRQTFRENWDVGFIVTAVGLILGWAIFVGLLAPLMGQTDPRMIVAWDPIPPSESGIAVKYRVQTTVGSLPFATALECAAPPCTVTNIEGTTTYKIRVAGVEADGTEGEYSDTISHMFASIQPLAPTSATQASATSTQPGKVAKKLSWTAVTKFRTGPLFPVGAVVEYRIYQAGTGPGVVIATSPTNSFTVQGLSKHKSFQFYVTCVVGGIESHTSPAIRVVT